MTLPTDGPCAPWATEADLCEPCASTYDAERLPEMLEVASWVLYHLSPVKYPGECTTTVRPCASGPRSYDDHSQEYPANRLVNQWAGASLWDSFGFCGCSPSSRCGCGGLSQARLPGTPVRSVDKVRVDGDVLDPSAYRVDNWRWLVRTDGNAWPCCQDLRLEDTEVGTWSVTYTFGKAVPSAGVQAAAELACELSLSCSPDGMEKCRLPRNVTQVVRQGVTMAIDPRSFLTDGLTGLPKVDLFLTAVREGAKRRRATVLSPDINPAARHVGT